MLPDCGILYKLGPYVVVDRVTVNAKKPAASRISGTSSHNSDSQVFARLNLVGPAVCPAVTEGGGGKTLFEVPVVCPWELNNSLLSAVSSALDSPMGLLKKTY